MFTADQVKRLAEKLDPDDVKHRDGPNGRQLAYVSGDHVIELANDIFGFGNWDAETVDLRREHEPVQVPPSKEHPRGAVVVTYSARVRVTVWNADGTRKIVRERCGGHRGFAATVGEAIENCIKAAETDATKRALVTFGNPFGLALYDKSKKNVGKNVAEPAQRRITHQPLPAIDHGFDAEPAPSEDRRSISERALGTQRPPQVINGNAQRAPATISY